MPDDAHQGLLFGMLALHAGLINADQLRAACALWSAHKEHALADILVDRAWLSTTERARVDALLKRELLKHAGDIQASLAGAATPEARRALAAVANPELQFSAQTLADNADLATDGHAPSSTEAYQPRRRQQYTLARLHAKGGIGQVWLARDENLGREVALKELRPEGANSPAVVARFLEEARIAAQLQHPGIIPVYELVPGSSGQPAYYTMKFIRGRTLADACKRYHRRRQEAGPLEQRELLGAFVTVCQAVAYAHSRGVIHRDLKSANVALGDFGETLVLDFGLSKLVGTVEDAGRDEAPASLLPVSLPENAARDQTVQGQVLGTPGYMAPEQAEGRLDRVDHRSDIYSLGAILYEILTGQPPFVGPDKLDILRQVVHDLPVPPRRLVPSIAVGLEAVCLKALAKRPVDRYGSATELAAEVQRFLADEPVQAFPEPWAAKVRRWLGKHQTLAAAVAAAVLVGAVALGVAALLLVAANDRERQARTAQQQAATSEHQARERAEMDFRLARQAVDGLSRVSASPELKALALEPLRRELLGQAKDFYEQLARQQADNPGLQAERGRAYLRLADITEALGDRARAVVLANQARLIFEGLCAGDPADTAHQDGLAQALAIAGRNYVQGHQYQAAQMALERAVAIRQQLRAEQPAAPECRLQLAVALNDLGNLYQFMGKPALGATTHEKARALCQQLIEDDPKAPDYQSELARTLVYLGYEVTNFRQDFAQGVALARQAAGLLKRLVQDHPRVVDYQLRLAETLASLSMDYSNLRKPEQAKNAAKEAVEVAKQLVRAHPDLPEYQKQLSLISANYALALAQLGDYKHAAVEVESAVAEPVWALVLYNGACAYCYCAAAVKRDAKLDPGARDKLAARYRDRAMSLLGDAEKRGFFKEAASVSGLRQDHDLDPLRQREDFKQLEARAQRQAGNGP